MVCAAAANYGVLGVYDEFYVIIGEGRQCYYEDKYANLETKAATGGNNWSLQFMDKFFQRYIPIVN